jgi:hypothetical protein
LQAFEHGGFVRPQLAKKIGIVPLPGRDDEPPG